MEERNFEREDKESEDRYRERLFEEHRKAVEEARQNM